MALLAAALGLTATHDLAITVISFSYRLGLPREADLVFDARFLDNPHYDPALRPLTGNDPEVGAVVEADPAFAGFFAGMTGLLWPLLPGFDRLPPIVDEYLRLIGPGILASLAAVDVLVLTAPNGSTQFHLGLELLAVLVCVAVVAWRRSLLLGLIAAAALVAVARGLGLA